MTTASTSNGTATAANARAVVDFLEALAAGDVDRAMELLTEDAVWINVSLPAVRGRRRIRRLMELGYQRGARFRVHFHNVATDHGVVRLDGVSGRPTGVALLPAADASGFVSIAYADGSAWFTNYDRGTLTRVSG